MTNLMKEILEGTMLFALNPFTWVAVIILALWTKQIWKPAIGGVLLQLTCVVLLILFLVNDIEFNADDVFSEITIEDIVLFF